MFIEMVQTDPGQYIGWIAIVGFSICVHEYAHAYTAYKFGDETAADEGHLTLNPVIQMGPMSLLMLVLIGIAWGMVPVDDSKLRDRRLAGVVAFAGPLSNLTLSLIFGGMLAVAAQTTGSTPVTHFLAVGAMTNGALFVLNMLPFPPLDGYQILASQIQAIRRLPPDIVRNASFVLLLLIFLTDFFGFIWSGGQAIATAFQRFWLLILPF